MQNIKLRHVWPFSLLLWTAITMPAFAEQECAPVAEGYAPACQTKAEADAKSTGCLSCHAMQNASSPSNRPREPLSDYHTMHENPGVVLGCVDCHGGDSGVFKPDTPDTGFEEITCPANEFDEAEDIVTMQVYNASNTEYRDAVNAAHGVEAAPKKGKKYKAWCTPGSATPAHTYTLLNKQTPEFVRFINPSDYRVARQACGACHLPIIQAAERSLMATSAMLWGGASYNNGILPFKKYVLGEAYTEDGKPAMLTNYVEPLDKQLQDAMDKKGILPALLPLPAWETIPPADIFRVFERGGRNIVNLFPETGLPNALGQIQRLEEPGRPDFRQSNRGPATGARIAVPVINITKTRLNDPFTWFMGTNEQPGDYRASGCAACHVVYTNSRQPEHAGPYAEHGHTGASQNSDPTIPKNESGHPIKHSFTRAIPTSQCMVCHMHQPNVFVNSYMGYTMWDYESDAHLMWPDEQQYPSHHEIRRANERNPEEAAARGKWSDPEFLKNVFTDINPEARDTQFADYHGHGWNFRAVFKRDRDGTLLDADGNTVADDDPQKFKKAVHMSSIHMDKGMHCVDCHFAQDSHGDGHIYGEVANAIEIDCVDCHGTAEKYPNLRTSGPAAPENGNDLSALRTQDGRRRFEWLEEDGIKRLYQRSALDPDKEWRVSLVKDSINAHHPDFNPKSARAKTVSAASKDGKKTQEWGADINPTDWAHKNEEMTCFSCHSAWATSCAGCHLPIQANWKTDRHHYEGGATRNYATYNPQVARDQMFQLGKHGVAKGARIAPVRSSSALVLSSTNANRERIYIQQPPVAASGYSSQAFAPHFPHTVRKSETKGCEDCHVSQANDNNAIMAQLLLQGTNFVNFVGFNAWVGLSDAVSAVQVTEWDEPQAVIGSYLHSEAYPDWHNTHLERNRVLETAFSHGSGGQVGCLQLRGEYLFAAQGNGMQVYDVAGIANKGISQRIITAPFSPLGHDTHVGSKNATCLALPTNQPIHPPRNTEMMQTENLEQPFHPVYNYAFITDSEEGLIVVDVNTMADGEPRNNFLTRAATWNDGNILRGARHITLGGHYAYIATEAGLVIVNLNDPLQPTLVKVLDGLSDVRASALQFRYLFVLDSTGLRVVDVTHPEKPSLVENAHIALEDAQRLYIARTYAYVAAKQQGLAIINVEKPEAPELYEFFTADGSLNDAHDVIVGTTNASLFAYVADGKNGLKVVQLTSPLSQPRFYGFSPEPKPELIARHQTSSPALSLSKGLDRDRAVDETGGQIAVFGRLGSRPFTLEEMQKLYLNEDGTVWKASNN